MKIWLGLVLFFVSACTVAHKRGGSADAVVETYRQSGQIQSCYKQVNQPGRPVPVGSMILAWKVDQTGRAKNARVVKSEVLNPELESCLLENLSTLKFPPQPLLAPAFVEFELAFDRGHGSSTRTQ